MSSTISPPHEENETRRSLWRIPAAEINNERKATRERNGPPAVRRRRRHHQRRRRRRHLFPSRQALLAAAVAVAAALALVVRSPCGADAALRSQITYGSPVAIVGRGGGAFGGGAAKVGELAGSDAAAALRELRGTVQSQAEQIESQSKRIESLKKQLDGLKKSDGTKKAKKKSAGGHGANGGVEDDIHEYLDEHFLKLALDRVWWLGLFLASLSLTAVIMSGFEHTLSHQIELAYFVPLLVGHGGNSGGQTVGTVLAAMSSGVATQRDAARIVAKEAAAGLSSGLVLGVMVAAVSRFVMGVSSHVSAVVLLTIPLVNAVAAVLASALPFMCVSLGLDPLDIAAPAMTTLVDVTGLLGYFMIARAVFKAFGLEL